MYYVTATDGVKLAVSDIQPLSNRVIVMVHGWPICKEMYEYQKDILVDKGYRIVSFDIRGFGDSETSGSGYDYNQLAHDVKSVIDHIHVDSVTLMGFSMGGAICVRYMGLFDNYKISKLILLGAAAPSFTKTNHNPYGSTIESVNELIHQTYIDRPKMIENFGSNVFALHHSDAFMTWFNGICFKGSGIGTIQTAVSLRDEDVFDDLSKVHVPTLIMHGRMDQICPYGLALIMNEQIIGSILDTFEYSGHGLFYDELYKCNQDIVNFIEKER